MSNLIILGAQWGDEGKGKIVDLLSERFDSSPATRAATTPDTPSASATGNSSSSLIPSGILQPGQEGRDRQRAGGRSRGAARGNRALEAAGVDVTGQLAISNRAHVSAAFHRLVEKISEARPGRMADRHHLARHRPLLRRQDRPPRHPHRRSDRPRMSSRSRLRRSGRGQADPRPRVRTG